MIDMHCHLDLYPEPDEVISSCTQKYIYVLSVTTTPKAWSRTSMLAHKNNRISTSLGLHPQLAHERYNELEIFDEVLPKVRFVGEVGLDGRKNYQLHYRRQKEVFRYILRNVQKAGGRIISIHSLSAVSDVLDELKNHSGIGTPILHWFTGSKNELKRAISLGCWFSVGPAMLSTQRGRILFIDMPHNRVITETDGPFAKFNSKVLMPWDVSLAFPIISKLWGENTISVQEKILDNFKNLLKAFKI